MPTISSAGIDDAIFVQELRDDLEDAPFPVDEKFSGDGTTTKFRLQQFPVWDADPNLAVSVGGVNQVIKTSRAALSGATDVFVEYDTGYLYFQSAPASGASNIVVNHYRCRWLNRRLLNALYAGLRAMFPRIWARKTATLSLATNQWEYALPADFLDPRCVIFRVEVQEVPAATERYYRMNDWTQPTLNSILLPWSQNYSPSASVRIQYAGPYSSLADLEAQVQHLPLWYAKGRLLLDKETPRARYDLNSATQSEQANPPGTSSNAGVAFLRQFDMEVARLQKPMPIRGPSSVYAA